MRPVSLHHIVAPDVSAVTLVQIASGLGCQHVCLFTQSPVPNWRFPMVNEANFTEVRRVMADHQVTAYGVTTFAIFPELDVSVYEPGLERGSALGAQYASVRIIDPDEARAADRFAQFGKLAARYGIEASIEFTGYRTPDALLRTLRIIGAAGIGTLSIDPLHIVRSEASLDVMRSLEKSHIGYVQLCDGAREATEEEYRRESVAERLSPGEGAFPLAEILALAPPGRAVSLEVPNERLRTAGETADVRASRVVIAARQLLGRFEPV
jgi:sugar phosphate isomerase/epimerase